MARKLIDQEEAARILGITSEQVGVLRDRKKLFPYRDGDQWKYKQEDIERYRQEMEDEKPAPASEEEAPIWDSGDSVVGKDLESVELASENASPAASSAKDSDELNLEADAGDEIDSILLSEVELGNSSREGASTIIGKPDEGPAADMDLPPSTISKASKDDIISLDDDADLLAASAAAPGGSMVIKSESGIKLPRNPAEESKNVLSSTGSGLGLDAGSSGFSLVGDSSLAAFADVKLTPSDVGGTKAGGSDKLFGSDALQLSDDELKLMDPDGTSPGMAKPAESPKKTSGSSVKLGDEELELVMGSKTGSDVTQSPTDSGIQLISPSDSGLSLDQPMALGSSARRLLDMPLDDLGSGEELSMEAPGTPAKPDEDFLLTAVDDANEESSDSGSQVIALDTEDELGSGMFAGGGSGGGLLEEEPSAGPLSGGGLSPVLAPTSAFATSTAAMMSGGAPIAAPAEAPYSTANITVLSVCVVLLMLCGMMTFDLMRNMWGWNGPYSVNSSILDSIGKTVGWMEK
jgi:Helix-turn-helix domain